jgi:DNA-binding MarR family transcriptional regulator
VSRSRILSGTTRGERVDYIAEHLPSRAAILVRMLVKQMRARDISRTEMEVLSILRDGPRRITELTELEGVAQPTMTLLVKRLRGKGMVARERVRHDGRVAMIRITPAGVAAQRKFRAQAVAAMRADLEALADDQLEDLCAATDTVSSFVDELQLRAGR